MPGLSVSEKNHWSDRTAARINRRIEAIVAHDLGFMERVRRGARRLALESLGLAEYQAERDAIAAQKEALEKQERATWRAILAQFRGVDIETIEEGRYFGPHDHEVEGGVAKRQAVHEAEVLAAEKSRRDSETAN